VGDLLEAPVKLETGVAEVGVKRGLTGLVDAVLFLAILGFSAVALLAVALAAPLAIVATAVAGALSAMTANGHKRGGWRIAGA
jgi:hypothetical protein